MDDLPFKPQKDTNRSPCAWFASRFTKQAEKYGMPMLEQTIQDFNGLYRVVPRAPNIDFMASIIDPEHDQTTIYIPRHLTFFRVDPNTNVYSPIGTEELMLELSRTFLTCAQAMGPAVDIEPLFTKCRSHKVLKQIVQRARSVLKVNDGFLDERGRKLNPTSLTPLQCVDMFAQQHLKAEPGTVLALNDCYAEYKHFCEHNGWKRMFRPDFAKAIHGVTTARFNIGLRHDLASVSCLRGWGWGGIRLKTGEIHWVR